MLTPQMVGSLGVYPAADPSRSSYPLWPGLSISNQTRLGAKYSTNRRGVHTDGERFLTVGRHLTTGDRA